jgi:antitoxin CcdA
MRIDSGLADMRATDSGPAKKPVNITINSDLLKSARQLNINLSATMETALTEAVKRKQAELWLARNRGAIAVYNKRVEADGVFSDGLRRF